MEEERLAKLVAEEGSLRGQVIALNDGDSWVIGRDPDQCDVVLEDSATSRQHLKVRLGDEGWVVQNLSTTNPILLNDGVVTEEQTLSPGDTLKIGSGIFRFEEGGENASTKPSSSPSEELIIPDEKPEPGGIGAAPPPEDQAPNSSLSDSDSFLSEDREEDSEELVEEEIFSEIEDKEEENTEEEKEYTEDSLSSLEDPKKPVAPISEEEVFANLEVDFGDEGRWMLKVISGPNNGAEFTMESDSSYIAGNDTATCDLIFHDISVSRQHARITVSDDDVLTIEDLGSRNGTQVDGETIEERKTLEGNQLVTIGTSTFVVIDREGERDTIVSPPIASLSRVIQDSETLNATQAAVQSQVAEGEKDESLPKSDQSPAPSKFLIGALIGIVLVVSWGISSLFRSETIQQEQFDSELELTGALKSYPSVQYSFSKNTGTLLLLGHVSTTLDRSQILYNLQELSFVKKVDDNIVIDELVWQEANQVLAKNPNWRSVTVQSPSPGRFIITGYLKSRADAEQLSDYLSFNFLYPESLVNQVVVEEDLIREIESRLLEERLMEVSPEIRNGELQLTGVVGYDKVEIFRKILNEFADLTGIKQVRNFVSEVEPQAALVDLSSNYEVTGHTDIGGVTVSIVVNGRILTEGDRLDGMRITEIKDRLILLEKDGFNYKIEFKK